MVKVDTSINEEHVKLAEQLWRCVNGRHQALTQRKEKWKAKVKHYETTITQIVDDYMARD